MIRKSEKSCLNRFESVGTCWNGAVLSHKVGMAVLSEISERSEFGGIRGFVGTVGTVCWKSMGSKKIGRLENLKIGKLWP